MEAEEIKKVYKYDIEYALKKELESNSPDPVALVDGIGTLLQYIQGRTLKQMLSFLESDSKCSVHMRTIIESVLQAITGVGPEKETAFRHLQIMMLSEEGGRYIRGGLIKSEDTPSIPRTISKMELMEIFYSHLSIEEVAKVMLFMVAEKK